ncbi:MAG: hypothetical protein KBD02_01445 [Bacteroides sp.]|jgi:hypothetical protein|nr:hypothetical protein [Bacteroides sp.]MBP9876319.1 hypothetical protein [Leptotrichiaceae bacterium]
MNSEQITSLIRVRVLNCNIDDVVKEDILTGKLGLAFTCLQIYKSIGDEAYLQKVSDILNDIFLNINNSNSILLEKMSLANGLPGLGLLLHYLIEDNLIDNGLAEKLDLITESVYKKCIIEISHQNFDYFYGSTGLLYYLIEVKSLKLAANVFEQIELYARENDYLFYNHVDDPYCQGINFGFAHGSFALLAVLTKLYESNILQSRVKELILKSLNKLFLFSRMNIDYNNVTIMHKGFDYPSFFPYNVTANNDIINPLSRDTLYHFTDRLGWCNSDLSRLYIIYKIAYLFNSQYYIDIADSISEEIVSRRDYKDTAISDCYMCHGTSGVAHLYKRLSDLCTKNIFGSSYDYWVKQTIEYMHEELDKSPSEKDLELLTGWLAPYFVLEENNGHAYKNWDSIFLLN